MTEVRPKGDMGYRKFADRSLVAIERAMAKPVAAVVLDGRSLAVGEVIAIAQRKSRVAITSDPQVLDRMHQSYTAMQADIAQGTPVYGCNVAYGGRASRVLNDGDVQARVNTARDLSAALTFLDVGIGPLLPKAIVRSAMAIRVNMLLQGVSAIRRTTLQPLVDMLNLDIVPLVNAYGGVAASGDLIHNQRLVSAARGLPGARVTTPSGAIGPAEQVLWENGIELLQLEPKEGLALVNGDNFSTAMALYVTHRLLQYYLIATVVGAATIEVLRGTTRSFHPLLAQVRPHPGQKEAAAIYRFLLSGSQLARQELSGPQLRENGEKTQDAYSLRCLPQFEGMMIEQLKWALATITINANSVSDNPLWVPPEQTVAGEEPWQWVSGGNFFAMHMVEVLDTLRKICTQLVKRNDRHLARLVDPADNHGLPPNLSHPASISHCAFKGIQILSGMLEVYSMSLANPISTLFGIHEERNQDLTPHATTAGNLALQSLELLKYSLAGNLLAIAQAVDLRGGGALLSPRTRPLYEFVRGCSSQVIQERPLHEDLEKIAHALENESLMELVREKIFGHLDDAFLNQQ